MKLVWTKKVLVLAVVLFFLSGQTGFSASDVTPPVEVKEENLITTWMKLALLGKNQAEIEFYFIRNKKKEKLPSVRKRIRSTVLDNLRRSGIHNLILHASDQDDLNVIQSKIITEIRYMGMEHDEDLQHSIKEEFGILLNTY